MTTLGEYLRSHREQSGVHLAEIADSTCINVAQLRAIEVEDFSQLPGGVFTLSFVKQYAEAVGADPEKAADLLKAHNSLSNPLPFDGAAERNRDPLLSRGPLGRIGEEISNFVASYGSVVSSVAVGLLLIVGGLYSYEVWEQRRADAADQELAQQAQQESQEQAALAAQSQPEPEPEPTPVVNNPESAITIELQIVEKVWIRAVADGERVLEGVYQAGDVKPIMADQNVTMKVGNAGGVLLALNGAEAAPIGPRGHVRSLEVTTKGIEILTPLPKTEPQRPSDSVGLPATTATLRWADLASTLPSR